MAIKPRPCLACGTDVWGRSSYCSVCKLLTEGEKKSAQIRYHDERRYSFFKEHNSMPRGHRTDDLGHGKSCPICSPQNEMGQRRMWYQRNPDVNLFGLYQLKDHTLWWASKGPCTLDYVPAFRGLASEPPKKPEEYEDPRDQKRVREHWDSIVRGHEFTQWMEDIFEEVRQEVRPEAPSRIGNLFLCPKFDAGFCSQPAEWEAKFNTRRNHVYEVSVTGTAVTLNSEPIGTARQYGAQPLTKYGGGFMARPPDFYYWKKDAARMQQAKNTIRDVAKDYWLCRSCDEEYTSDGLRETIVEGEARIVRLVMIPGQNLIAGPSQLTLSLLDDDD